MQIVIEVRDDEYRASKTISEIDGDRGYIRFPAERITNGIILPEHHGDLKDIGNMELLNVQVHDDYSKGWHNAIEYCVRQLRERPTIIPATKEGE